MQVELTGVCKDYVDGRGMTVRAVDGLTLDIRPGELVTLLGPSGCGKTTALRLIAGFEQPSAGSIRIDGADVSRLPPHRRDIGMVFQSYALFPHLSVRQNATFGLEVRGRSDHGLQELAATLRLGELLERAPHELSGGQQQRVALLRALVTRPKALLLDEPLSNLDARLRVTVRQEIRALQQQLGITTINVTHDQEEALALSDRIVLMQDGRVAQAGTPAEVYDRPSSRFVASFLGEAGYVPATIVGQEGDGLLVDSPLGRHRVRAPGLDGALSLLVRPEAIVLEPSPLQGRITSVSYLGPTVHYMVEVAGHTLPCRAPAQPLRSVGETVGLRLVETSLHLVQA